MSEKMKAAVMNDIGKVVFTDRDIPTYGSCDALIKLEYVGICGSDIHYYENGRIGNCVVKPPFVLGHEAAGTVVGIGSDVKDLKVGDRVALEPGKTCGRCYFCKTGHYNLCPDVIFFATPPVDGVFKEYAVHSADLCFKLPDTVSTLEGALIEPLSIGFYAVQQGGAYLGKTAVVIGAGCIGLVSLLALKAVGVSKVYVIDILENRLEKALELGAKAVLNPNKENVIESIMDLTDGVGCDLVIETAGLEKTIDQSIQMTRKGGAIVLVGYSNKDKLNIPVNQCINKELTLKTIFRYRHIYPMAIEAVASGAADIQKIVSNIFEFNEIQKAMDIATKNKSEIIKAVIKI